MRALLPSRGALRWLLVALAAATSSGASRAALDTMIVPGGLEALCRLEPRLPAEPEEFSRELLPVLLSVKTANHDALAHPTRLAMIEMVTLAETLDELLEEDGTLSPRASPDRIEAFCEALGYQCFAKRRRITYVRGRGVRATVRRRIARALELGPPRTLDRLAERETIRISLARQEVPSPFPHSLLSALSGSRIGAGNAFALLARDQRVGLVLDAWSRLDRETRAALPGPLLAELAEDAPHMFHALAPALAVEKGVLRVPGGPAARALWEGLLGESPDSPRRLVRALLEGELSPGPALWLATAALPDAEATRWLEHVAAEGGLAAWEDLLSRPEAGLVTRAFPAYAREHAPGSLSVEAMEGTDAGRPRARAYTLLGSVEGAPGSEALATVAALERTWPDTLRILEDVAFDASLALRYRRAMERIDAVDNSLQREALGLWFQGALEILGVLRRHGLVEDERARVFLDRFFTELAREDIAGARALSLFIEVLEELPDPGAGWPGRSAVERKLLAAMVPRGIDAPFERSGLRYRGPSARAWAGLWLSRLEEAGAPTPETLKRIADTMSEVCAHRKAFERSRASSAMQKLQTPFRRLVPRSPDPEASPGVYCRGEAARSFARDWGQRMREGKAFPSQRRCGEDVSPVLFLEAERGFAAFAYMDALGDADNPFLRAMRFHARHSGYREPNPAARSGRSADRLWSPPRFVSAAASGCGARIAGHLGGLGKALVAPRRIAMGAGWDRTERLELALGQWLNDARVGAWALQGEDTLASVASLVDTGRRAWNEIRAGGEGGAALAPLTPLILRIGDKEAGWGDLLALGRACVLDESCAMRLGLDPSSRQQVERSRRFVNRLPHLGAFALDFGDRALIEREGEDLRVAVAAYLGARGLPGHVGARLHEAAIEAAGAELHPGSLRDWEHFVLWGRRLDGPFFEEAFLECLLDAKYLLSR